MSTKTKKKVVDDIAENTEVSPENKAKLKEEAESTTTDNVEAIDTADEAIDDADSHFKTLLVGLTPKLSSKSSGLIGYEVALNTDDKCRYLRLTSNDSGGLFSKEWVKLDDLYVLLEAMETDKPFKSSVFKSIIKGGSANNVSFLSAVLRSEEVALILKSEKSQFLHVVNPLLINQRDRLAKLKPLRTSSTK
tara:strand:- start:13102 stop:13677 length:576 start_codon:yes stop_codon:yes gene_type:complete